jgi:PAS domain S-box-containing protein
MSERATGPASPGGWQALDFTRMERRDATRAFKPAAGLLGLLILALVSLDIAAQAAVEAQRTIRVVLDNAYAPYSFQADDGKLQGILIDQWHAWEKKTGIRAEINGLNWSEALRRMRAGEFDVIDSIVATAERRQYFDFTSAYAPIEASIYFRNDISGIADLASLKGFPVGVKAGDQHIDQLEANGVASVIVYKSNDEIIEAARQHKIGVFVVDDPSALYQLSKKGLNAEFRRSAPVFRDELRRAVRKGDAHLLRTVSEGFAAIGPADLKKIDEKWFGRAISSDAYGRYLTYARYAAGVALLLMAGLFAWNRTLKKKVLERTVALGESEQRFGRLVELMPIAVYVCDRSGVIQSYNKRAVELWGREPEAGSKAQLYCGSLRLYSPEGHHVPHEDSKMAHVLRTGAGARDLEVVIERPDGSRITALVNISPLRDVDGKLTGAMNCFQDITERKHDENALRDSAAELRALSQRLVDLQESERRDLSRELHDRVGQNLTALSINLGVLKQTFGSRSNDEIDLRLEDSAALLESTMAAAENLMSDLRPPMLDDHGLLAALDWYAGIFSRRTGIAVSVRGSDPAARTAPEVEIGLFRIAQEALNNVAKHAAARGVEVALDYSNGECVMAVQDDGIGFDGVQNASGVPKYGFGIVTMRERSRAIGGRLDVARLHGGGTRLTVHVPY